MTTEHEGQRKCLSWPGYELTQTTPLGSQSQCPSPDKKNLERGLKEKRQADLTGPLSPSTQWLADRNGPDQDHKRRAEPVPVSRMAGDRSQWLGGARNVPKPGGKRVWPCPPLKAGRAEVQCGVACGIRSKTKPHTPDHPPNKPLHLEPDRVSGHKRPRTDENSFATAPLLGSCNKKKE